ncbi:NADH:ubiquinone oxidoreductase subunit J [Amylibacter ulvae]|uniref:NADH-quinone oxidoreductase subunit J n=1 Tax=Paramylibacter ulvae TaxID=1651968 RepID=A0ABQ3D350_9RHOB|nr:NADH-quinone oxidoreductase subunit J [Amylibacter ulvae]GHA53492.1 NADH:ubiquinone oxidoreductase subunit J [Amylibacter ulvae]
MGITLLAFYLFAIVAVCSGLFVVLARNPVHSVLWLILAFFSAVGMFILIGAEFVAMILAIVYVGAVAVLFLFVVMMLDVDFVELKGGMAKYLPFGLAIGAVLLIELGLVFGHWNVADNAEALRQSVTPDLAEKHNTIALGSVIYTDYIYLFQASGLILLVAMIGAIVLTLRHRTDVKRQNIQTQMHRDPAKTMEIKNVKPGQGL